MTPAVYTFVKSAGMYCKHVHTQGMVKVQPGECFSLKEDNCLTSCMQGFTLFKMRNESRKSRWKLLWIMYLFTTTTTTAAAATITTSTKVSYFSLYPKVVLALIAGTWMFDQAKVIHFLKSPEYT